MYFEEDAWAQQQESGFALAEWFEFSGFRDDLRHAVLDLAAPHEARSGPGSLSSLYRPSFPAAVAAVVCALFRCRSR